MPIDKTAIIHPNCSIHPSVKIHEYVVIYPDTIIEEGVEIWPHALIGKVPTGRVARNYNTNLRGTTISSGSNIGIGAVIYRGTTIGKDCLIGDYACLREENIIGDRCLISRFVTTNYNVRVGDGVKVMDGTHLTGNMIIEDGCFLGTHISTVNDNQMNAEYGEQMVGPIIRRGARIGCGAILLSGVEIGQNSIVAAGSVVTKDVPLGARVMGIPARIK